MVAVLLLVGDGLGAPILFLRFIIPSILYYVPWDSKLIRTYTQKISVTLSLLSSVTPWQLSGSPPFSWPTGSEYRHDQFKHQ